MSPVLYYIHDPMCSWCWGFRPSWDSLKKLLPKELTVKNLCGGLARDSEELMSKELQQTIQAHWHTIESQLGTQFNHEFWRVNQPRRATYMACRAVIAAKNQNSEEAMINAIQRGYYLRALNPSDIPVLVELAIATGMDEDQFRRDLTSVETEAEFQIHLTLSRNLPIKGFPSLVLLAGNSKSSIEIDYLSPAAMLKSIKQSLDIAADSH